MTRGGSSRPTPEVGVAVLGARGRMGQLVVAEIASSADLRLVASVGRGDVREGCFGDADVVVDFSLPEALADALPHLGSRALVTGTTGLPADVQAAVDAQSARGPVLQAANFSTGVTLLLHLVAEAAAALPDYDVEIVEAHHRLKQDAPSGTALALARAAADAREQALGDVASYGRHGRTGVRRPGEIGVHAVRMGDVVGEHDVWLATGGERVRLGHVATSRQTFAKGAVRAARWIAGKPPGRYDLRSVLGLR